MRLPAVILILLGVLGAPAHGAPDGADRTRSTDEIHAMIERAEPGDTIRVPGAVYIGNLVISKPVTLDGSDGVVIDARGEGSVIEVRARGVTVRSLTVRASGSSVTGEPAGIRVSAPNATIEHNTIEDALFGIDLRQSSDSIVRSNRIACKDMEPGRRGDGIRLWWSHNCVIEDNTVRGSRDMVFWYSENLRVSRNTVSDSRYGLHFMYSHDTVLEGNDLHSNSVGVYLMYSNRITLRDNRMRNNRGASGYGIGLKDCDDIVITNNALLANRVGVYLDNSPSSVDSTGVFESNMIAFNEIGLLATPNTHDNVFTNNAFIENEEPAATHGRGRLMLNEFSRDGSGNYWSDYAGFDLDRDGVGDVVYEPRSLFGAMLAREPNLRLFVHSPAQQAIEFTARALPELRPESTLIDPAPLASPPGIEISISAASRSGLRMGVVAIALILIAGACTAILGADHGSRAIRTGEPS